MTCRTPIAGVSELKLFTFPGTYRLRLYHLARVAESGADVRPDPSACVNGRSGVRRWEHGRVACWRSPGRSKMVLHWIDERTQTYGIIRADAGEDGRLGELWQTLREQSAPSPAGVSGGEASPSPPASE